MNLSDILSAYANLHLACDDLEFPGQPLAAHLQRLEELGVSPGEPVSVLSERFQRGMGYSDIESVVAILSTVLDVHPDHGPSMLAAKAAQEIEQLRKGLKRAKTANDFQRKIIDRWQARCRKLTHELEERDGSVSLDG